MDRSGNGGVGLGIRLGALALLLAMVGRASAQLVCDQPVYKFGVVKAADGFLRHVFDLRNAGRDPVRIEEVATPCGCLMIQLPTNLVAAGATMGLPVTLDPQHRSGDQRLAVHVRLHAGDGEEPPILSLYLTGTIVNAMVPQTNAIAATLVPASPVTAPAGATHPPQRRVVIELFGEAGCDACATVRREVLPEVKATWGDRVEIRERDVFETTNYVALANYQDRFHIQSAGRNDPVSVVVDGCRYLGGVKEIRSDLAAVVRERIALDAPPPAAPPVSAPVTDVKEVGARKLAAFSIAGVAAAGLLDGLNPCAFATVIFLASLLAVARVRGHGVLLMGGGFIVATFGTYFLIGLGLFHGLKALTGFRWLAKGLDYSMAAALVVLAVLSLRDAWRFADTGRAASVTLRMPDSLRRRVHGMLRERITPTGLLGSGLVAGSLVTILESVCTGQVYGPTLMAVAREPGLRLHAMRLLAIYNLAFLVPVIVVMIAAWRGTTSMIMADWSRRNAVWGKVLMGLFFLGLAVLILAT